jgi:hypothetical protein
MNMASWENPTISQIISQKTLSHPMFLFRIPIVEHQIQKTSVVQPPTMNNQLNQLSFDTIWYLSTESHHILSYHFFIHGSQKISCHKTINININIYIYIITYHIISYHIYQLHHVCLQNPYFSAAKQLKPRKTVAKIRLAPLALIADRPFPTLQGHVVLGGFGEVQVPFFVQTYYVFVYIYITYIII